MKTTSQLRGNSLGVRIPAPIAHDTDLTHGPKEGMQREAGRIVLTPTRRSRRFELKSLLTKFTLAKIPDRDVWDAPIGKEVW
ncbi:MAG: hypothetical protein ABSA05_03385 [Opitutaceae bacterium]|jgi:antitoxin component of MazEF toxin-antitoxin module